MYRICDLTDDSGKPLRKNIDVRIAVAGNRLVIPGTSGSWTVKRVHGYSILPD